MNPPRFLLLLSVHENLLRASLVTRDLKIASSAKQTFTVHDDAFDPAEMWYKMKEVIAACFDIGRTQPRELLAGALLGDERAWCIWQDNAGDVDSVGFVFNDAQGAHNALTVPARFRTHDAPVFGGTARAWLLWNLSGAYVLRAAELPAWRARAALCDAALTAPRVCADADADCFGMMRARSPFAEALRVAAVFSTDELVQHDAPENSLDLVTQHAAARAFAKIPQDAR